MAERQDPALRLLDVLLEEEIGGARDAQPARSRWQWLAAAATVLLAVGVVIGIAALRPPAAAPRPAQDPVKRTRWLPADAAAFRAALATVQSIALAPREAPRGVPVLGGMPLIGNLFRKNGGTPAGALQELASTTILERFSRPAAALATWREALAGCTDGGEEGEAADPVTIDLADGRQIDAALGNGLLTLRGDDKSLFLVAPQKLIDLRAEAAKAKLAQKRRELGIALDLATLNGFPEDQSALSMPPDPALVTAALARCQKLERLRFFEPTTERAPWDQLVPALAGNRSLRALHGPAAGLTDEHLRALQAIGLRELEFDGLLSVGAAAFAGFGNLESLAIPALADGVVIDDILRALPGLRALELGTNLWRDELIDQLLRLPVHKLRIGGPTVDAAALARLSLLPHLRELELFLCRIGPDELTALGAVKQLAQLRLRLIDWHQPAGHAEVIDRSALAQRLPKCRVVQDD